MLTRVLWLQLCVRAFRDEVFGTALQKARQRCQHSKNLITLAGRVVVGFGLTQQNMIKKTSRFEQRLPSWFRETSLHMWTPILWWIYEICWMSWVLLYVCSRSVSSLRKAEVLKYWMRISLTKPPTSLLWECFFFNSPECMQGSERLLH